MNVADSMMTGFVLMGRIASKVENVDILGILRLIQDGWLFGKVCLHGGIAPRRQGACDEVVQNYFCSWSR